MVDASLWAVEGSACELMQQSLAAIGNNGIDIVPRFFERFYAAYPQEQARFCNRASSEGLMVNEMLSMLLAEAAQEPWLSTMMRAQVNTHHDHGDIHLAHYRTAFDLLLLTLAEAADREWHAGVAAAWQASADRLCALIASFY